MQEDSNNESKLGNQNYMKNEMEISKTRKIKDLAIDDRTKSLFLLVKAAKDLKSGKNTPYIELILEDGFERVLGVIKNTNIAKEKIKVGTIMKFNVNVLKINNKKVLEIIQYRDVMAERDGNLNRKDYVYTSPATNSKLKINDLKLNEKNKFIYLLVTSAINREARNSSSYIELTLEDGENKIIGKVWNTTLEREKIQVGRVMAFYVNVAEWLGIKNLSIVKYREISKDIDKDVVEESFIRKAPISSEKMFNDIYDFVLCFKNETFKQLVIFILNKYKDKLAYYPAAQKVHHDIKSGLLYHIYEMLGMTIKLMDLLTVRGVNAELLYTGVILHDIGKIEELASNEMGKAEDYTVEGHLLGHIIEGIEIVILAGKELNISQDVISVIKHMILTHHGDMIKDEMFIEAILLHYLDMIDSRVYMMNETTQSIDEGTFSGKQFFLNNSRIYNHGFK